MKYRLTRKSGITVITSAILLYTFMSFFSGIKTPDTGGRVWEDYYTLLVERNAPVRDIESELSSSGAGVTVSEYTSSVPVFSHIGKKEIAVSELESYYDPADPLYDPFLRKLADFFRAEYEGTEYSIIYIESDDSLYNVVEHVESVMGSYPYNWRIVENSRNVSLPAVFLFFLIIMILTAANMNIAVPVMAVILPWIYFILTADISGIFAASVFNLGMIMFLSQVYPALRKDLNLRIREQGEVRKAAVSASVVFLSVIYYALTAADFRYFLHFSAAAGAVLSGIVLVGAFQILKRQRQQHRLFFPVLIKKRGNISFRKELLVTGTILVLLSTAPLVIRNTAEETETSLPVPHGIEGLNDFSQLSLQALYKHSEPDGIPDLSDYVAHMVYLESYSWGGSYSFPEIGMTLDMPLFSQGESEFEKKIVTRDLFTDPWYESIMSPGNNTGIIRLLLQQKAPVLVVYQTERRSITTDKYLKLHYWFCVFLGILLAVWFSRISPSVYYGLKDILLRRKQQTV